MLRVSEQYSGTDTGRQRRANEDSLLARAPLFVVADGMGGAQAGEVASRMAVDAFRRGLDDRASSDPEGSLTTRAQEANAHIYELSQANAERAGMGTTLTAAYVGPAEVSVAHVGDSRAYCLRDEQLLRLTDDHSLVDELVRQGKLTPAEAEDHPQRSIITRALGPEPTVEVDTRTHPAKAGDVYLLCSDGLTTMLPESRVEQILRSERRLRAAGETLMSAANEAGGRDNITVVLFRLDDAQEGVSGSAAHQEATLTGMAPSGVLEQTDTAERSPKVSAERRVLLPRKPGTQAGVTRRRRRRIRLGFPLVAITVILLLAAGGYLASQSVYFVATNSRGLVTIYSGFPLSLPGDLNLYSQYYVSGVPASSIPGTRRHTLLNHSLRSESNAAELVHSLELETSR